MKFDRCNCEVLCLGWNNLMQCMQGLTVWEAALSKEKKMGWGAFLVDSKLNVRLYQ